MGRDRAASQSLHRHQTLESERGLECPDLFAIGAQTRVLECAYDPTRLDCGLGRMDRVFGVCLYSRRPRLDRARAALPARKYHVHDRAALDCRRRDHLDYRWPTEPSVSGFCYQTYGPRRLHTVLNTRCAGLDFEFLERIGEWHRHIAIVVGIVVIGAIEREIHSGVQSAGHRHVAFAGN